MSGEEIVLRPATEADIPAICAIYEWEVLNRAATFELSPPDEAQMLERLRGVRATGLPYLAADCGGKTAGFAYAAPFRTRAAYRFTAEDSVYVSREHQRRGIGAALLAQLLEESGRAGIRHMTAVISDPENNAGSLRLHQRAGFSRAGHLPRVGWKFGRWIDAVIVMRPVGAGGESPPE